MYRVTLECDDEGLVFHSICFIGKMLDSRGKITADNVDVAPKDQQTRLVRGKPMMTVDCKQRVIPRAVLIEIMNGYNARLSSSKKGCSYRNTKTFTRILANSGFVYREILAS